MTTATQSSFRPAWTGQRITAVMDYAASSHARAVAMLVLCSLVLFLPGFFQIPPTDRDESRFAQASKQMVESGDYVDIRFQSEFRYKKPVGIYWLQAGVVQSARAFGVSDATTTIWLYRIPALIGAIGAVLLTYWTALCFVSRRAAMLAALMMAGSVLLGVEARLAKTDAFLLLTIMAAMGALARAYMRHDPQRTDDLPLAIPAIFWTALAAGVLIKGPLIFMFVGLTVLTLAIVDRSLRWVWALRPAVGTAWLLLLVLPWFLAIVFRSGGSFFASSLGEDMMSKVASGQESHGAPPGLYFLLFWFTFWPGALLAGLAAPAVWRGRREKGARFLLAWLVPAWIVFELVMTKLPHYVLPLYPAIAILIAGVVDRVELSRRFWLDLGTVWWLLFPLFVTGGVITVAILFDGVPGLLAWLFAAAAVAIGLLAWRSYSADKAERALLLALVASALVAVSIYGTVLPSMTRLFPSVALANILEKAHCGRGAAASAGYQEPSLVFLAGTSTLLTNGAGAADFLAQGGDCRFAFVEVSEELSFRGRAQAVGLRYVATDRVAGINYANGRRVSIAVYRAEARP
jgi:4-amino-4-deoxy-L-arabinose transferase-like glycosyltransferase